MTTKKSLLVCALFATVIGCATANAAKHDLGWGTLKTEYSGTFDLYTQASRDTRTDGHCVYAVSQSFYDEHNKNFTIYHPWSCYSTMHTSRYVAGNLSRAKLCRTGGSVCGGWKWH